MISYVTLGTNGLGKALDFYDALLADMGANRAFTTDKMAGCSFGEGKTMLSVVLAL